MPANSAAWLDRPFADLAVRPAPYPLPGPGEIVVRARAVAVNPLDLVKQSASTVMYRWLPLPAVLGEDVAGEVVEVGSGVSRFRVGDRVLAYAVGMEKGRAHRAEGGFQLFPVVLESLAAPIPDGMAFEDAVVLPLAVSTAASALFQEDQLGLRHPGSGASPADQAVVVWGGSTSVGSNAIQLAVAAGYRVLTTASPANQDRARALGASDVFDYRSPTVVADVVRALDGADVVGVLAVGTGSAEPAVAIAAGVGAKRVSLASPSVSFDALRGRSALHPEFLGLMARLVAGNVSLQARCRTRSIRARFVWGSSLMHNEVGPMLWESFLPDALASGRYVASPAAQVVGSGLEQVQVAMDALRDGVSARKLVVLL
ncbi:zinc-binding alcohol dehydrogenase family protein [Microbacteriaceae bacterium 4G12]